jgi:hypothetical protein
LACEERAFGDVWGAIGVIIKGWIYRNSGSNDVIGWARAECEMCSTGALSLGFDPLEGMREVF